MSSLFQEMEEFTLFDGLVPSSGLLDFNPTVEDQLDSGILFPGDSLVKPEVGPSELFEDFLSNGSVEDPFSQEWMETVDFSSLLNEATNVQPVSVENVNSKSTGSSCLLEELLKKPIQIKSSPTVSQNVQTDTIKNELSSVQIDSMKNETIITEEMETGSESILEQAIKQIDGIDTLVLQQHLHDIYNESISIDTNENTSNEISLIDSSNEFLISSPLSSEDIDSILSSPEPASPSSSVQDDPDYVPSLPDEKKSRRTSRKANKSRLTPYEVPEKVDKLDKKERKRIQNRNAAIRYREKKRAERGTIVSEEDQLSAKNKELKTKVEHLSNEINYMKNLLTEVCEARGLKIQFK